MVFHSGLKQSQHWLCKKRSHIVVAQTLNYGGDLLESANNKSNTVKLPCSPQLKRFLCYGKNNTIPGSSTDMDILVNTLCFNKTNKMF